MHVPGIEIRKQRFRRRSHAHALLQFLRTAMRHPGNLRRKSLNMILLLLKKALRNQAGKIDIFHAGFLESAVQLILYILPDRISRRLYHHEPLQLRVAGKLRLLHHIGIPLGEVLLH